MKDQLDARSEYILGAFYSVSTCGFDVDSGVTKGLVYEVGELELWISDDGMSRETNYRECSGIIRTTAGEEFSSPFVLTQEPFMFIY